MPNKPLRKAPRLDGFDYSEDGLYFLTICVHNRQCLFGAIEDGTLQLNEAGESVAYWWAKLPARFPGLRTLDQVVMPNHFHGVIEIDQRDIPAAERVSIPKAMQWFKTITTNAYIRGVKESGWKPFEGKLWQRSYHDHIIRNETVLFSIQRYIADNPANWTKDEFYAG